MEFVEQCIQLLHFIKCVIEKKSNLRDFSEVLARAKSQGLPKLNIVFFHCKDDSLLIIRIVYRKVDPGNAEVRTNLHSGHSDESISKDVRSFLLEHNAKIPFDKFRYLLLSNRFHTITSFLNLGKGTKLNINRL